MVHDIGSLVPTQDSNLNLILVLGADAKWVDTRTVLGALLTFFKLCGKQRSGNNQELMRNKLLSLNHMSRLHLHASGSGSNASVMNMM